MAKALTKEDLLYILQSIFKISEQENNAFTMLKDGLYTKDYKIDLSTHTDNTDIHIDSDTKQILNNFSISESGLLLYNNAPVTMAISNKEGNGVSIEIDGLYIPNVAQSAADHIINTDIHVSPEDREHWNNSLQQSKDFTKEEMKKLITYNIELVSALPEPISVPTEVEGESTIINPSSTTLYLLKDDKDCPEECTYTLYMYLQDKWNKLSITNQTLHKFVLKTEIEEVINNSHTHNNKETLDRFSQSENGELLYDNKPIHEMNISTKENNAIQLIDGKLYVRNFDKEIHSMQTGGFIKYNLYDEEINDSGVYELKDDIDKYSLILVEYYYKPDKENEAPGCAKTAIIDTDILNHLYLKNIDYMLEYGYGVLMSNSKIRMHENKLWVDYYHNVCIYKITGIRRGDDNE